MSSFVHGRSFATFFAILTSESLRSRLYNPKVARGNIMHASFAALSSKRPRELTVTPPFEARGQMPIEWSPIPWPNSVLHPIIAVPTNNATSYNEESASAPRFAPIKNASPCGDRTPIRRLVVIGKQTSPQRQRGRLAQCFEAWIPGTQQTPFYRWRWSSRFTGCRSGSYVFEALARHELAFEIESERYAIAGPYAIDRPIGMLMANGPPHESEIDHVKDQRDATLLQRRNKTKKRISFVFVIVLERDSKFCSTSRSARHAMQASSGTKLAPVHSRFVSCIQLHSHRESGSDCFCSAGCRCRIKQVVDPDGD
jgi:hypothetical protein